MAIRSIKQHVFFILIGFVIIVCIVPVFIFLLTLHFIFFSISEVPQSQTALILGASVKGRNLLSPILLERTDAAVQLYKSHKVSKILVSGDNGTVSYNEVSPVGKYLLSAGIPLQDIFLDHAGFDTYSSMYRAKYVFNVSSVIVVSQMFHLPRAVFIARSLGLTAYGYSAHGGALENWAREIPASDRAVIDVLFARTPQYMGSSFPIGGSGASTWP